MMDLVVEGRLFLDGELTSGCVGVKDGKIAAVKKVLKGDKRIDAGDMLVLPAGIDPHVHFREPGYTNKEDCLSCGKSQRNKQIFDCSPEKGHYNNHQDDTNILKNKDGNHNSSMYRV